MNDNHQLYWGHGLFLAPQHLQQQDLYHDGNRGYFWRVSHPFGWGIRELLIREEGFADGLFEILRCEIVTRDGTVLRAGTDVFQSNASIPSRSFTNFFDPASQPLGVYIGVPRYRLGQNNIAVKSESLQPNIIPPKYFLRDEEQPDLLDPEAPSASIRYLNHNLVLLFNQESAFNNVEQAVELIKIAELELLPGTQAVRMSPQFLPPCLTVASSPSLFNLLKGLRDLLTGKGQEFAVIRRQRGVRAAANVAQEAIRLQMLQTLSRYIPAMHHVLDYAHIHPEPIYGLVRQMIGEFSIFSEDIGVLGALTRESESSDNLPPYKHEDMRINFRPAVSLLQELIRTMTLSAEAGIRLIYDGKFFKAPLPPSVFEGEWTRYYLMIDSLVKGDDLWARLQRTGKITTIESMPILLPKALMGLKINPLTAPLEELPQKTGNQSYFMVDTQHPEWRMIRERGNIAMFCDLNSEETIIKLFVVRDARDE